MIDEAAALAGNGPTRILYVIDGLEGDGAERQLCELVKGIQVVDGFEPHVVVLEEFDSGHSWMLEEAGISINVFARRSRLDYRPVLRIVEYIRQHGIDLVHAYMCMGSEFGLIAGRICRIPVIASSIRNAKNRNWREAFRTYYQAHLADRAVANSQAGFDARFSTMRPSYRVIRNGFDPQRLAVNDARKLELRSQLGLTSNLRLICMAARMEPQKDHLSLLHAMPSVIRSEPNALLLLAGQGSLETRLEIQAKKLGIADAVRFLGHQRDIECLFALCEVSLLLTNTDIHREGISNTIIESMAAGSAVVATRGGGTDEILGDEDSGPPPYRFGIKVDPHSPEQVAAAISYYLGHPDERARIADAARRMVQTKFGLDRFIDSNVQLYRELISDSEFGPTKTP